MCGATWSDKRWKKLQIARSCGTKQISKSKDLKIEGLRPLLGSSDVERAHAVLARRKYPQELTANATLHYNYSHNNNIATTMPHYTTLHYTTLHYTTYSIYTTLHRAAMLHYTGLHSSTLPYANYSYTHATANAATAATRLHCTKLHSLRELHYHYTKLCSLHYTALKDRTATNTATTTTTLTLYYTILYSMLHCTINTRLHHNATLHSIPLRSIPFHSSPFHSVPLIPTTLHYATLR